MEWIIGTLAVVAVFFLAARMGASSGEPEISRTALAHAHDRMNFLSTLRRELANYLVWKDPEGFQRLSQLILAETSTFTGLTPAAVKERWDKLSRTYPHYEDFDLVGTRDYVLYEDTLAGRDVAEIEQHYRDIAHFQALNIASDPSWKHFDATSASEQKHLADYVGRIKDTQLRQKIERAVREWNVTEASQKVPNDYENEAVELEGATVKRVPHFAETRLGIYFRDTHECGLYGIFYSDDGKHYEGFYRSDPTFETERRLDTLYGVLKSSRLS